MPTPASRPARMRPSTRGARFAAAAVLAFLLRAPGVRAGELIATVQTDAARHLPRESIRLTADLHNHATGRFDGEVEASVLHLGRLVVRLPAAAVTGGLAPGAAGRVAFTWTAPDRDFQGYQVLVTARARDGRTVDRAATAIDVSSDWSRYPRYGYIAHYEPGLDAAGVVAALNALHLNGLQFYDWQWKHHEPYTAAAAWRDIANRPISRATLERLIAAAHARRMMAMNYNLYGGAVDGYTTDGSGAALAMGIFARPRPRGGYTLADQTQVHLPAGWATHALYEMNNRDPAWQRYISGREREVFAHFAFDGWHVDALGTREGYDFAGARFSLIDQYPEFLNAVRAATGRPVVFNCVDAAGQDQVAARARVEFVYSELWDEHNPAYGDIARRVEEVRANTGKAVVFAAYPDRGLASGQFGEPGVRLLDAAIFASGAAHLELGDAFRMLHDEYFPDDQSVVMGRSLQRAIRADYDFLVAYENLLRDGTVSDDAAVSVAGRRTSTTGAAGAVWVITKRNSGNRIAHFINLLNRTSTAWRDNLGTAAPPPVLTALPVKMYYSGPLGAGRLWCATPDDGLGCATPLAYTTGSDAGGPFVRFVLPRLEYWTMAWLEVSGSRPATSLLCAGDADTLAAAAFQPSAPGRVGPGVVRFNEVLGGAYAGFNAIDFGAGVARVIVQATAAAPGAQLEVHLDAPNGPLIAAVAVPAPAGARGETALINAVARVSGVHPLFVRWKGARGTLTSLTFATR